MKRMSPVKVTALAVEIVVAAVVLLVFIFGSMYTVSEQQSAVVTQFGRAVSTEGAGLHFKLPIVQDAILVDMTTRGMEVGYRTEQGSNVESESFMITQDFNFVNVDFFVEYRVSDPIKYLYNSQDPVGLLRNIMQAEARSVVSTYVVDDALTTAKVEIQARVKDGVVAKVDEYDLGIMISNVSIQDAEPPTAEVVAAFKDVENAKQNKSTQINEANKYQNEVIPQAQADADKIVKEAEAVKESRINEANGQVARFNEIYAEYSRDKDITRTRMYLEAMEEILPGVKVIIANPDDGGILKILDIGANDSTGVDNTNGGVE